MRTFRTYATARIYPFSTPNRPSQHRKLLVKTLCTQNSAGHVQTQAYHQLWRIEKSFRMSKHDLRARPIYHHKRESIEAHLTIVFAALAVTHWIEHQTGWSIKKFVGTARRHRTVTIQAGRQTLTAVEPLSDDLAEVLATIHGRHGVH